MPVMEIDDFLKMVDGFHQDSVNKLVKTLEWSRDMGLQNAGTWDVNDLLHPLNDDYWEIRKAIKKERDHWKRDNEDRRNKLKSVLSSIDNISGRIISPHRKTVLPFRKTLKTLAIKKALGERSDFPTALIQDVLEYTPGTRVKKGGLILPPISPYIY